MDYLCLLYRDEAAWDAIDPADRERYFAEMDRFAQGLAAAGQLRECRVLEAASTATTLRVHAGKRMILDGPFIETKEQLVGYYVLAVPHLDAAIAAVTAGPTIPAVATEIRPVTDSAI